MKARWFLPGLGMLVLALGVWAIAPGWGQQREAPSGGGATAVVGSLGPYALSEPFTHNNLAVFMIYGKDRIKGDDFLTLQEAIKTKAVTVFETQDVRSLLIENHGDKPIYIQSGEILKGGKQDRTLPYDVILPARSGKMPIQSFCVERGRWSRRGGESTVNFNSSSNILSTKALKLAARSSSDQGEVWKEVANAQRKLSGNLNASVNDARSASSLELSLDNPELKKAVEEYIRKLSAAAGGKKNAIGFAFAINGQVNSIDVYASNGLFRKLWPKLLKASAVEAVAERKKGKTFPAAKGADVRALIAAMEKQKAAVDKVSRDTFLLRGESPAAAYFETRDAKNKGVPVHRSYLKKD
jgi:hypothetical protein